jgi:post-segregation antitoxin (ccd killing protein)
LNPKYRDRIIKSARERAAQAWLRRNRSAVEAYNRQMKKHGVFSEGLRSF